MNSALRVPRNTWLLLFFPVLPILLTVTTVEAEQGAGAETAAASKSIRALLQPTDKVPRAHYPGQRSRAVLLDGLELVRSDSPLVWEVELFDGHSVVIERERLRINSSGSTSWIGQIRGDTGSRVVLVSREGITVGSIRFGRPGAPMYLIFYGGREQEGEHWHGLYEVQERGSWLAEDEPTETTLSAEELALARNREQSMRAGRLRQDDGSIQDLLVVYTPAALDAIGDQVALENLIDLGVIETNLSYENSGVNHRLRLVHTALTDYDEMAAAGDPRDLLQDPADGFMDEVHPLRDEHAADLVKLLTAGGGCGRAFIMAEVSLAFEAFAFCRTRYICVSPGYTFQHELGHIQGGRHQWNGDNTNNAPFTFNHGYLDQANSFRTIMAGNDIVNCPDCTRRLHWSNPDVNDPVSGAPMGIPEGQPLATDNRKTLNATAWTVANFRVSTAFIFSDGFENGMPEGWVPVIP